MENIYPCFDCNFKGDSFFAINEHIEQTHTDLMQKRELKVWSNLYDKYSSEQLQQIAFIPARYLSNKRYDKINAGYDNNTNSYYLKVGIDTKVALVQNLKGYKPFIKMQDKWILSKKRV